MNKIVPFKKILFSTLKFNNSFSKVKCFYSKLYEPDYLEALKPQIPLYDTIDIQLKGYDFRLLENCQRYIHMIAENMEIDVEECWATPAQKLQIQRFKPNSQIIDSEYILNVYERNIQIVDIPSPLYPTFLRLIESILPRGVQMTAREHLPEYEEIRYVPDKELLELKTQLEVMSYPKK